MRIEEGRQLKVRVQGGTYVCHTKERYEEGGNDDEEGELLSVLVEEFELVDQPCDHRFHPTHLWKGDRTAGMRSVGRAGQRGWGWGWV